ncbi:hypothetical protein CLV46_2378 [Diaminobutyricimonas aerilata]|uniref:Uncharacterized protein n=1 Tax=Diaminobutyricimonas aerilata TaxID=1162967 RepID=A0A2M9CLN1_9MICO|nr:hypothetical protein [Diaminobutyricimonas aerilata]PJJ72801.1 hypothetical protein CLV46_2378 [Diaminobutyricimonas aerilata]
MDYTAAPKPWAPIEAAEVRRLAIAIVISIAVGAVVGVFLGLPALTSGDPSRVARALLYIGSGVCLAGFLGASLGGWRLIAGENDFAGRDRPVVRRVRRTVLRGKTETLDEYESEIAARFARAYPTIAVARLVAYGLLVLSAGLNQTATLTREPGAVMPVVLTGAVGLVLIGLVCQTTVLVRRARRYRLTRTSPSLT